MKKKSIKWIITAITVLVLSACSTPAAQPTVDSASLGTIVAQNVQLTQLAATLTAVIAQESATPKATETPNVTATATPTPMPSFTPTPLNGLWLTFDQDTRCRFGPGTYYKVDATVAAGNKLQAIARSEDGQFFYVRYFDTYNHYCWVTKDTSFLSGNTNWVPVYTAQPTKAPTITPTVEAGFNVTYASLENCSGKYFINLNIKNIGLTTWQSIMVIVVDNTGSTTVTNVANAFTGYTGCNVTQTQGDLSTNEPGLVSVYSPGEFTYNPAGHPLAITVNLYSEKGQAGTVMTKSLSVTP